MADYEKMMTRNPKRKMISSDRSLQCHPPLQGPDLGCIFCPTLLAKVQESARTVRLLVVPQCHRKHHGTIRIIQTHGSPFCTKSNLRLWIDTTVTSILGTWPDFKFYLHLSCIFQPHKLWDHVTVLCPVECQCRIGLVSLENGSGTIRLLSNQSSDRLNWHSNYMSKTPPWRRAEPGATYCTWIHEIKINM